MWHWHSPLPGEIRHLRHLWILGVLWHTSSTLASPSTLATSTTLASGWGLCRGHCCRSRISHKRIISHATHRIATQRSAKRIHRSSLRCLLCYLLNRFSRRLLKTSRLLWLGHISSLPVVARHGIFGCFLSLLLIKRHIHYAKNPLPCTAFCKI